MSIFSIYCFILIVYWVLLSTTRSVNVIVLSNLLEVFTCNINERTILRPANSWITASTNNYSHNYTVSQNCPFDYCLPRPSHLHLSYPNSQCQFNRSGLLCGQCQQGLSTVFGSSQCRTNALTEIMMPSCICCHDKTLRDRMRSTRSATCRDCQTGQAYLNDLWRERANLRNICAYWIPPSMQQ